MTGILNGFAMPLAPWAGSHRRLGLAIASVLAGLVVMLSVEAVALGVGPPRHDFDIYRDASLRWLSGGPFYPAWQTSGPYQIVGGAVLYPPAALALFLPFTVLGFVPWVLVPLCTTLAVVAWWRPGPWACAAMAALVLAVPSQITNYVSGTPTIWIVAIVAVATRWPWAGALVLLKPSVLPFALVGIRTRGWWLAAAGVAAASLALLPLTLEWARVTLDGQGGGLLYSWANMPLMAVPLVARLGSSRRPRAVRP